MTVYDPRVQLSRHFNLREFTKSALADRLALNNMPREDYIIANLKALCERVLEPLRAASGRFLVIGSGYRSPALNKALSGSETSQHMLGEAADIALDSPMAVDLAALLPLLKLPVDQAIFENRYEENGAITRWLHISHRRLGQNRGDYKTQIIKSGRRDRYEGLFVPDLEGAIMQDQKV